jgi:hypothetical protein
MKKKSFWASLSIICVCLIVIGLIFLTPHHKTIKTKPVINKQMASSTEQPNPAKKDHYVSDDNSQVDSNDIHPLFDNYGLLIGGVSDNKWISAANIASYIKGGEKYKVYSEKALLGEVIGSQSYKENFISGDSGYYITFGEKDKDRIPGGVFCLSGDWNAYPRTPTFETSNLDKYNYILKSLKPSLTDLKAEEAISVDLDGDGINELLIVASQINKKDMDTICSDPAKIDIISKKISLIILNTMQNSKETNDILYESQGCTNYSIPFVADINNNNQMEMLVETIDYGPFEAEGFAFIDYELVKVNNNRLDKLLHVLWHPYLKNFEEENLKNEDKSDNE